MAWNPVWLNQKPPFINQLPNQFYAVYRVIKCWLSLISLRETESLSEEAPRFVSPGIVFWVQKTNMLRLLENTSSQTIALIFLRLHVCPPEGAPHLLKNTREAQKKVV